MESLMTTFLNEEATPTSIVHPPIPELVGDAGVNATTNRCLHMNDIGTRPSPG